MRRCIGLPTLCLALLALGTTVCPSAATAATGTQRTQCAETEKTTIPAGGSPASPPGSEPPCWEEIGPYYPFGRDGRPVGAPGPHTPECEPGASEAECYLTVTSMAFRAWNRGLAATTLVSGSEKGKSISDGVWVFDGTSWTPNHSFPGNKECPGNTIVWAGKLDYWLVGPGPADSWPALCRYDGYETHSWEELKLPEATLSQVTPPPTSAMPNPSPSPGGITSAACFAWNNCWFFGTYGVVVHWNGKPPLEDASPPSSEGWLHGEYTAAVARENLAGEPFGVAVGADREFSASTAKLPQDEGATAPQMYGSRGDVFSPLLSAPPLSDLFGTDPFGTDLVAADFDAAEQGWVAGNPGAGNPGGLRLKEREGNGPGEDPQSLVSPVPSPLEPVSVSGASTGCKAPAPNFEYRTPGAPDPAGAFLWSSISVIPSSGEALAGGSMRQQDPKFGEPVIVQASCDGTATLTRFRVPGTPVPADREGGVTAIAANAANDAWAATSQGNLGPGYQPPRLYRLTDEKEPEAPKGNDDEERPHEREKDKPFYEEEKPPVETAAARELSLTVTPIPPITLPPAIYDVKVKLHKVKRHGRIYLSLYLTFKVLRPVTLGAEALRHGRVVSRARARHFAGQTGELILSVERKRWPTKISFVS